MKYSSLSFGAVSIATTIVFFLITMQVSFAQTATQLRLGTVDVSNVRSERPLDAPKKKYVPTQLNNTDVRKTEARTIKARIETKDRATSEPRTFLEKARDTLQEKREELRDNDKDDDRYNKPRNDDEDRSERLRDNDRGDDRDERVAELKEQKKNRVSGFLNNIKRKVDAAISRLETLGERIESRIVKFEERGLDMTEARRLLEVAKGDIRGATESIETAVENAKEALAYDPSRESFGSVVSELSKAKESLRSAHASLVEVIRAMKASLPDKPTDNKTDDQDDSQDTEPDTNDTGVLQTN